MFNLLLFKDMQFKVPFFFPSKTGQDLQVWYLVLAKVWEGRCFHAFDWHANWYNLLETKVGVILQNFKCVHIFDSVIQFQTGMYYRYICQGHRNIYSRVYIATLFVIA